jgi:hypothetical protein
MITIDEAIIMLARAKNEARLGGQTVLHVCIPEIPYVPVKDIRVENDPDGSVGLVIMEDEHLYLLPEER